jgi:hypothetical protein
MNLDENLRTMLRERAESVAAAPVVPERTARRAGVRKTLLAGAALAVVAAVAVTGGFVLRSTVLSDAAPVPPADRRGSEIEERPEIEQNPVIEQKSITRQVAIISQMADAINARDADAFIDLFEREGSFNPRGVFHSSSLGPGLPVADTELVWAWMDINDAWGLQAEVEVCDAMTGPINPVFVPVFGRTAVRIECEVRARWHNLSLEIIEGWNFEFEGTRLLAWGLSRPFTRSSELVDLNPPDRTLPLGYDGLLAWEEWLKANHPEAATRYLNPRAEGPPVGCDGCQAAQRWWDRAGRSAPLLDIAERSWSINGYDFSPVGYIPYDPAYADEIQASIQDYLDER